MSTVPERRSQNQASDTTTEGGKTYLRPSVTAALNFYSFEFKIVIISPIELECVEYGITVYEFFSTSFLLMLILRVIPVPSWVRRQRTPHGSTCGVCIDEL